MPEEVSVTFDPEVDLNYVLILFALIMLEKI